MMTLVDIVEELAKIDGQIINLLEERVRLCKGQSLNSDDEMEMLSQWLEEAAERGLDDGKMEKIAKLVIMMSRAGE